MLGAALALASAACFGLNNATVRRGVIKATVLQGMAITVPLGVPIFVSFAFFMGGFDALQSWQLSSWVWMALAGIVHFVLGRYGNYRATQALGATLSTPVQQLSILIAMILALLFLGEHINGLNLLGIVLIMGGPAMLVRRRKTVAAAASSKNFEPQFASGIAWGAVCTLGYGTSPLLIRLGLGGSSSMADGVAGVLVSYAAATAVVAVLVVLAGGRAYMAHLDKNSGRWFLISSIFVALSQLLRYLAFTVAPVTVVVPIQRLSVVFRILFNAVLNRDYEVFDYWVMLSIFLALLGTTLLSVDSGFVLSLLSAPAELTVALVKPLI